MSAIQCTLMVGCFAVRWAMSAAKFQMVGMNFKRCDLNVRRSMHADGRAVWDPAGYPMHARSCVEKSSCRLFLPPHAVRVHTLADHLPYLVWSRHSPHITLPPDASIHVLLTPSPPWMETPAEGPRSELLRLMRSRL
jgi:hypothetical protein